MQSFNVKIEILKFFKSTISILKTNMEIKKKS